MGLYRVFDAFEANGVIHKTGSSVDVHRVNIVLQGGYTTFFLLLAGGGLSPSF